MMELKRFRAVGGNGGCACVFDVEPRTWGKRKEGSGANPGDIWPTQRQHGTLGSLYGTENGLNDSFC